MVILNTHFKIRFDMWSLSIYSLHYYSTPYSIFYSTPYSSEEGISQIVMQNEKLVFQYDYLV